MEKNDVDAKCGELLSIQDHLGHPVAVGDEVWDLGCSLERHQWLDKYGTIKVRRLPVVAVFSWGVRLRKANGDEIDTTMFERVEPSA